MRKFVYISIVCILTVTSSFAQSLEDAKSTFQQGNEAYKGGDYETALEQYLLADESVDGFDINYNLGNTYFKLGQMPQAILHYERALKYAPTNEDVAHNLKIANTQIVDRIEAIPQSKLKLWWQDFKYNIGPGGWAWICIGWAFLAALMAVMYFLSQDKNARRLGFFGGIVGVCLLVVSYVLGMQADEFLNTHHAGVVFTDKVDVRSEPRDASTQVFVLHAGTKVILRDKDGDWYKVEIASGNEGWMKAEDLAEI